jgi:hypothetical protein
MPIIDQDLLALASPAELTAYEEALKAEMALLSPLDYAMHVSPTLAQRFKHSELLNLWLVALIEGRLYRFGPGPTSPSRTMRGFGGTPTGEEPVYRLTISMPPRHGKSFIVSEHFPAWFLTKFPDLRLILASYEADFAASWGMKARDTSRSTPSSVFEVDPNTRSGARWNLDGPEAEWSQPVPAAPSQVRVPTHSSLTTRSRTPRRPFRPPSDRALFDWYVSTAFTRLERWEDGTPGRMILMNTRWHEDDLNGRVTLQEPEKWAVLNLPALAEDNDQMGRDPGEPSVRSYSRSGLLRPSRLDRPRTGGRRCTRGDRTSRAVASSPARSGTTGSSGATPTCRARTS